MLDDAELEVKTLLGKDVYSVKELQKHLRRALQLDMIIGLSQGIISGLLAQKKIKDSDVKELMDSLNWLISMPPHEHKLEDLDLNGNNFLTKEEFNAIHFLSSSEVSAKIDKALKPITDSIKTLASKDYTSEVQAKIKDLASRFYGVAYQKDIVSLQNELGIIRADALRLIDNLPKQDKFDSKKLEEDILRKVEDKLNVTIKYNDGDGKYYRIQKNFAIGRNGLVPSPTQADVDSGKVLGASGEWITAGSGSGTVDSVVGTTGQINVDATDPANPIISLDSAVVTSLGKADSALQSGSAINTLDATAWRVFYSDGSGNVTELALGADGTFLKSNGASAAPTFATPAGSGDVSKVGTPADNQVGVWTGDGTIEGTSGLTYNGSVFAVTGNITVTGTVDGRDITTDGTKLDGIEAGAQVNTVTPSNAVAFTNKTGNISQWTNDAGYLTSYTETDTLSSVTGRGASTSTQSTFSGGLITTQVKANSSAGVTIQSNNGTAVAEFGAGGGGNWTFEDGVKLNAGTASRILATDASKNVQYLDTATYPDLTELSYSKGVTSALQTQLNGKQPLTTVLTNTTASFTTAQETKLGHITVTQAVNLDTMESDIATNNAKVSNATHTGDVTGATALTVDKTAITGKTEVTAEAGVDYMLISDTSDSGNLKKALVPSGASGSSPLKQVMTSGQATSSTALADVTELVFAVAANTSYKFDFLLFYQSSVSTEGLALSVNAPSGATIAAEIKIISSTAGAGRFEAINVADTEVQHTSGSTTGQYATVSGSVDVAGTSGNLALRFATETGGANTNTLLTGSYGILTEVTL